jgi:prolyl 4-hydroxylase
MFERIINDPNISQQYNITILSRPTRDVVDSNLDTDGGPWIVMIDDFFHETEANRLIELGANAGYYRSTENVQAPDSDSYIDEVTDERTSTNAWCDTDECRNDPIVMSIYDRIEKLVHIPMSYSEELQLLRYEKGQFYKEHHDYNEDEYDMIQGKYVVEEYVCRELSLF